MERKSVAAPPTRPASIHMLLTEYVDRATLVRSLKTALVVGTVLAIINHGQKILSGQFSASWMVPTLLTYLVPFSVATYGQIQGKRQRQRGATPRDITNVAPATSVEYMPVQEAALVSSPQFHHPLALHGGNHIGFTGSTNVAAPPMPASSTQQPDSSTHMRSETSEVHTPQTKIAPHLSLPFTLPRVPQANKAQYAQSRTH